ncbi:zf-HC2 domain-containing protein [Brevibacillus daliensis]|uniref:zf-HC2 domain-containing protein n=1 Tax=Brevibacillus daliensis TaxID=2892995 RepID=UPI001E53677E|nr:zf-HC2 domain-containing protein [Brevibacillus daliensis]
MAIPCEETQWMLPWLVNGTLQAEEKVSAYHHLAECVSCREELKLLDQFQQAVTMNETEQLTFAKEHGKNLLQSIMKRIDDLEQVGEELPCEQEDKNVLQRENRNMGVYLGPYKIMNTSVLGEINNAFRKKAARMNDNIKPAISQLADMASIVRKMMKLVS